MREGVGRRRFKSKSGMSHMLWRLVRHVRQLRHAASLRPGQTVAGWKLFLSVERLPFGKLKDKSDKRQRTKVSGRLAL